MKRKIPLITHEIYHIFNRGVEKRKIFLSSRDYQIFLDIMRYYIFSNHTHPFSRKISEQKNPLIRIVEIICYCLMPNHFHFMIRQKQDNGISLFMSQIQNSYVHFFNKKYKRVGPLFQGVFKAVRVASEEQLIHLSRYIHLNPYTADIVDNPENYPWSSCKKYISHRNTDNILCSPDIVLSHFSPSYVQNYRKFLIDYADYAKFISKIKHISE